MNQIPCKVLKLTADDDDDDDDDDGIPNNNIINISTQIPLNILYYNVDARKVHFFHSSRVKSLMIISISHQ